MPLGNLHNVTAAIQISLWGSSLCKTIVNFFLKVWPQIHTLPRPLWYIKSMILSEGSQNLPNGSSIISFITPNAFSRTFVGCSPLMLWCYFIPYDQKCCVPLMSMCVFYGHEMRALFQSSKCFLMHKDQVRETENGSKEVSKTNGIFYHFRTKTRRSVLQICEPS